VVRRHPDPSPTESVLSRGFGAAAAVVRTRAGIPAAQDWKVAGAGLPRPLGPARRVPAAMDQIFPHELLHVIVRQLAGAPRQSDGHPRWTVALDRDL